MLDDKNSEKKEPDFYDLIVEIFNNNKLVMTSEALPNLHDDSAKAIAVPMKPKITGHTSEVRRKWKWKHYACQ